MEIENYLQFLLFILCGLGGISILIFFARQKDEGYNYDKIINDLNQRQKIDLQTLKTGNKKINKLEKQILECKKELNIKLFKK